MTSGLWTDLTLSLAVAVVLLLINGFLVLSEFALVKVRSSRIEELSRQGSRTADLVSGMLKDLDAYLSAIQLGITVVSLSLGWISEPAVAHLLEPWIRSWPIAWAKTASHSLAFAVALALITYLHVVIGELTPRAFAIRYPTRAILFTAAPLRLFRQLCYFPMLLLKGSSRLLLQLLGLRGVDEHEVSHSEEELKILLAYAQERGKLPLSRLLLFENVFDFGAASVKDVMTPSSSVAFLSIDKPWEENRAIIEKRKHTRYPLCGKDLSEVKGIVHLKDLALACKTPVEELSALRRLPLFLLETDPLEKALAELRRKRTHLALAHNKTGQVTGLITLEDVLEELVGEIQDEFESPRVSTLSEALVFEAIDMRLIAKDKAEAVRALLQKLISARPELNFNETWDMVWKREQSLTCAVGRGIALPHARVAQIEKPLVTIGRLATGIEFGAPDKKPVVLIFLILSPMKDPGAQLRILAKVAALASHRTFRRNLIRAQSAREALDVIQAFEQTIAE